jgi:hypothetical protein
MYNRYTVFENLELEFGVGKTEVLRKITRSARSKFCDSNSDQL